MRALVIFVASAGYVGYIPVAWTIRYATTLLFILVVGLVYRFSPVSFQIRDWIRQGVIGTVRSLRLIYIWDLHGQYEPAASGTWIASKRSAGRAVQTTSNNERGLLP